MTTFLIILIVAASAMQKGRNDTLAAVLFSIPMIFLWIMSDYFPDSIYYHINSLFALAVIYIIHSIKNKLAWNLTIALLASIFINSFGFICWFLELSPAVYNNLFIVFYGFVLYIVLKKGSFQWTIYTLRGEYWSSLRSLFVHTRG